MAYVYHLNYVPDVLFFKCLNCFLVLMKLLFEDRSPHGQLNPSLDLQHHLYPSTVCLIPSITAVLKYRDIHGDMNISRGFVIPKESSQWPTNMWGVHLGR